jgi:hypothetical protein
MMKFARLLLESYSQLYEQQQDATQVVASAAGVPKKQAIQVTNPTTNTVGLVWTAGKNSDGATYFANNPKGTFPMQVGNNGAAMPGEGLDALTSFLAGQDEKEQKTTGVPEPPVDPILSQLSETDQKRLENLESQVPGITNSLKIMYENSLTLMEDYPDLDLSPRKLLQKILGGETRGSLSSNIEKELTTGTAKIDRTDRISFALDPIGMSDLSGSISTMRKFTEIYAKSRTCDASMEDMKSVTDKIRKAPGGNHFFFAADLDDKRFGVSLSVADGNPLNLMAEQYNKNVESCKKDSDEDYTIPEKDIVANATGDAGNFTDMVTNASEDVKVAAFEILYGDEEKGKEMLLNLVSRFGKNVFNVLQMKRQVQEGDHVLDEKYQQAIDTLDSLGIEVGSDVISTIKGPLRNYMLETMSFVNSLKPDYAVRVGQDTTTKGDKSDVDYIMKTRPDSNLPKGALAEVKFEDLSREAKKAIINSGDERQDTYFVLKNSLKTYTKEGDVKLGDSSNLENEASRLTDPDNPHGSFVFNALGLDEATQAGATRVLSKMQSASANVKKLMSDFTTNSYPTEAAARKFVSDQVTKIMKQAGMTNFDNSQLIKDAMKEYNNNGAKKAVGLIDRVVQQSILQKGITYNSDGSINKRNKGTMNSLAAFAAIQASIGIDSTGTDPMSEIHILSTGNTYRENQNEMILEPIRDLLDPKSRRSVNIGAQTWRITGDGSVTFNADKKGKCSANSYINTNYLKKN